MAEPTIGRQATPIFEDSPDSLAVNKFKESQKSSELRPGRVAQPLIPDTGQTIGASDPMRYVRQGMSYVRGFIDTAAGAGGAMLTGPTPVGPIPGRIAGNLVADQAYQQLLQRAAPSVFGAPPEDFKSAVGESLLNAGADTLFSDLIPAGLRKAKSGIAKSAFKPNPLETESRDALKADPSFPISVGQGTQSKLAKTVEGVFGGQKLHELQATQQGHLTKSAEDFLSSISHGSNTTLETPTSQLADISSNVIKQEAERGRNMQNALYTQLEKIALPKEKAIVAVPTNKGNNFWNMQNGFNSQFGNAEIQGPIRLKNTVENAKTIGQDIDAVVNDPTNVFNPKDMNEINLIKEKVDSFTQNLPYDKNGDPVISYRVAKAIKTGQIDFLQGASEDVRKRLTGTIENLKNSIGSDMNDSVNGNISKGLPALWSPDGQKAYNAATAKFKQNLSRFSPDFAKKMAAGADPDIIQEQVMQQALSSAKQMKQYKAALDPNATEPLLLLAKNVLNKARGVNGVWDGEKGMEVLKGYTDSGVAQAAFPNSSSLQSFKYLLSRMRSVSPETNDMGKTSVFMYAARGGAAAGTGALTFALTGNAGYGAITGGAVLAAIPLTKHVISEFMLNPTNARRLAGIATSPPASYTAQNTIKQIFKTGVKSGVLKGIIIDITDQNQRPIGKATFDSNGNLVPINDNNEK